MYTATMRYVLSLAPSYRGKKEAQKNFITYPRTEIQIVALCSHKFLCSLDFISFCCEGVNSPLSLCHQNCLQKIFPKFRFSTLLRIRKQIHQSYCMINTE